MRKDEDGYYYLRSSDFDSLTDDETVRERALELIEYINGAARLHFGENEDAHGVRYDRDALAEKARLRLRDVGRTEDK